MRGYYDCVNEGVGGLVYNFLWIGCLCDFK